MCIPLCALAVNSYSSPRQRVDVFATSNDALINSEISSLATTYLSIDGSNANTDIDIGGYGLITSSNIISPIIYGGVASADDLTLHANPFGDGKVNIGSNFYFDTWYGELRLNNAAYISFDDGGSYIYSQVYMRVIDDAKIYLEAPSIEIKGNVSLGTYNIAVGSITGYGGDLTGIVSGIDLSDQGVFEVNDSTFINLGTGLQLDGSTIVNTVTDTDTDTDMAGYKVVIGTYSAPGIQYISAGTDMQGVLASVYSAVPENSIIYIMPGTTYYFSDISSVTVKGLRIKSDGAILCFTSGVDANSHTFFYINATDVVIDGLIMSGFGSLGFTYAILTQGANANRFVLKNCEFRNAGNASANNSPIYTYPGTLEFFLNNITLNNVDTTYAGLINGEGGFVNGYYLKNGCAGYMEIRGVANILSNVYSNASTYNEAIRFGAANRCRLTNSVVEYSGGTYSIASYGDDCEISNCTVYYAYGNGIGIYDGSDRNKVQDCILERIGMTGGNVYNGIYVAGDYTLVEGNSLSNTIDDAVIAVHTTADGTQIHNNIMHNINGNTSLIEDNGTNTVAEGNYPTTENFEILVASQTITGKPDLTPTHVNTRVRTKVDYNVWISTGLAIDQWQQD